MLLAQWLIATPLGRRTDYAFDDASGGGRLIGVTLPEVDPTDGDDSDRPGYTYGYDDYGGQKRGHH